MSIVASLFKPAQQIPDEYRSNFSHLYQDIAWFGITSGSVLAFITIYAARLGATSQQLGLLNATPAVVSLIFALPAGTYLETRPLHKSVFLFALIYRSVFLIWMIIPWFFAESTQVSLILFITLVGSVPLTYLSVGFNALFADAVPPDWRAHVVGIRNVAFALTATATTLICGWILNRMPFPDGYQVVFGLGFVGGVMSGLHVYKVRSICLKPVCPPDVQALPDLPMQNLLTRAIRFISNRPRAFFQFRTDLLSGSFGRVLGLLAFFHLSLYLPTALFPIVYVNTLNLSDQFISMGTAANSAALFLGSTLLSRACSRYGNHKVTGLGIVFFGVYPFFLSFSNSLGMFVFLSVIGGLSWSMAGGALYNYLLEKVPSENRPPYLAWYNIGCNAAILLASLAGPWLGNLIGYPQALMLIGVIRALSGLAILRFG